MQSRADDQDQILETETEMETERDMERQRRKKGRKQVWLPFLVAMDPFPSVMPHVIFYQLNQLVPTAEFIT